MRGYVYFFKYCMKYEGYPEIKNTKHVEGEGKSPL
jgi:hypothetical protein